jgi:very-short-patch-repair endonuclease
MKILITETQYNNIVEGLKPQSKEDFISKAKKIHGDKYNYDDVNYVNSATPVQINCPKHGPFMQSPNNHMSGKGCKECGTESNRKRFSSNKNEFVKKSKEIHGDKYDYSQVDYVNSQTPVKIICHKKDKNGVEHGVFKQIPNSHVIGYGCKKCGIEKIQNERSDSVEEFIEKAKKVHGEGKYDYNEVNYTNAQNPVIIICHKKDKDGNEHGPFLQSPNNHISGKRGCPKCKTTTGENIIRGLLDNNKINFIEQYQDKFCTSFKNTSHNRKCIPLKFDFYLTDMKVLIEFDGKYHFEKHPSATNDSLMSNVLNDREKNNYTKLKGIKLIRIGYMDVKNIEEEIIKGLKSEEQLYLSTNYPRGKGWDDENFNPTTKFVKKYIN